MAKGRLLPRVELQQVQTGVATIAQGNAGAEETAPRAAKRRQSQCIPADGIDVCERLGSKGGPEAVPGYGGLILGAKKQRPPIPLDGLHHRGRPTRSEQHHRAQAHTNFKHTTLKAAAFQFDRLAKHAGEGVCK